MFHDVSRCFLMFVVFVACAAAGCGARSGMEFEPEFDEGVDAGADSGVAEADVAVEPDTSVEVDAGEPDVPDEAYDCNTDVGMLTIAFEDPGECNQLVMGSTSVVLGYIRFRYFYTGLLEPVDVRRIPPISITSPSGGTDVEGTLLNFRLLDEEGAEIAPPIFRMDERRRVAFDGHIVIPEEERERVATLVADVNTYPSVVSGLQFRVGIDFSCPDGMDAVGVESGCFYHCLRITRLPNPERDYYVYRSRPVITVAPDSPVGGTAVTSSGQIVGKWRVTNTLNDGSYTIWFQGVVPWFASTITVRNGGDVRLYWDSPTPANEYLHLRYRPGSLLGYDAVESTSTNPWREIASGAHRDMIAVVDTTDAQTNNTLTVGLDPEAPYPWTDEEGELVNAYRVCDPPSLSWTFRY